MCHVRCPPPASQIKKSVLALRRIGDAISPASPHGEVLRPIDDAIHPAYHLQTHLKQWIAKDDKAEEQ